MNWNPFKRHKPKSEPIQPVLYKYVPPDKCRHWLENRTIGFPGLRKLNDPYESLILRDFHSGAGARHIWQDDPVRMVRIGGMQMDAINPSFDPNARFRRIEAEASVNAALMATHAKQCALIDQLGILSLSRSPKSMTMWAHYAGNSSGLCFGIEWRKVGEADVLPIDYVGAPGSIQTADNPTFIALALGRKHADWGYEREVRLVRRLDSFSKRTGDGMVGILNLDPQWIVEIIVGVMPSPDALTMLTEQWQAFSHARLLQLRLDGNGYEPSLAPLRDPSAIQRPEMFPLARATK